MNSLCPIVGLLVLLGAGFCCLLALTSDRQGNCAGLAVIVTVVLCVLACVVFGGALF